MNTNELVDLVFKMRQGQIQIKLGHGTLQTIHQTKRYEEKVDNYLRKAKQVNETLQNSQTKLL